MKIDPIVNPSLPLAPTQWDSRFQDQYSNVLRLFFTKLATSLQAVFGTRGGQYLSFPCGAFHHTADVVVGAANTPTLIPLNTTDFSSGVFQPSGGRIQVRQSGVWNLQFSVQFANTDSQSHNAYLWLRKGGSDLADTTSAFTIPSKHGGGDGYAIGAANFYVDLDADEYVELWWATDNVLVKLDTLTAQTAPYARPLSPSVVVSLTFVSSQD